MKKVRLYGELGKKFNSSWELNVSTIQEALSAIEANSSGFFEHTVREHVKGNKYIILLKDPLKVESENDAVDSLITKNNLNSEIKSDEIHILPVPKGGAVASTVIGGFWVNMIGKGVLATVLTVATYVAIAVAISFITQALFKPPAPPKPGTKVSSKSLLLAGQRNRQAQGIPVPLGYGLLKIGSANIDAKVSTFNLKRNSKSKSSVLESYSTTEYIDLLCEGPIAGLVDKNGNLLTTTDIREGIYLNNVQIKNTVSSGEIESFNYVLNEDDELPKLKKGLSSDSDALSSNISYTIQYGTQLYGPGPYLGGTAKSVYNNFESAIKKQAFIFSHAITDRNVSKITIQFAVNMMQMNKDPGDTLSDSIRFVIFYTKNGKRINILDPSSDINSNDIHYLEGTPNSDEVNGKKITKGLQKIQVGDNYFFMIQGLATSFYEFSISVKYDPGILFVDNSEQLNFSVVKLTSEFDQSVDSSGSVSYDNPNGNNSTFLGHVGGIMRQKSIKIPYIQESIEEKVIYPHTAAVKIKFDSKNFNNIPVRSYHIKMKKILVPSNYEPESRTYNGPWNGLFAGQRDGESVFSIPDEKRVWSNNPGLGLL
jgi:predicted phage tail protein